MGDWTKKHLNEVHDAGKEYGYAEIGESRFPAKDLGATDTGVAYHVLKPGKRQGFGHRHDQAEEVHVVIAGSGRVKLDDEIVELETLDALRLAPDVKRRFEAGPEGMAYLVFGPRHEKDGQLDQEFWTD
jgi:mannose-6-phosphate isomerase-like protein (cupin superfamily)